MFTSADFTGLSDTVDAIYKATLEPDHWTVALEHVNTLLGANGTCYVRAMIGRDGVALPQVRDYGLMGRNGQDFSAYTRVSHLDPRIPHLKQLHPGNVLTEYDFMTEPEIEQHPFYADFMLPNDLKYTVCSSLPGNNEELLSMLAMRSPDQGPPEGRELELGRIISTHLARSSEIERRLDGHLTMQQTLLESLDAIPDGLFVIQADGRVIHANRQARLLLANQEPFADINGILRPVHNASRSGWKSLLDDLNQTVPGKARHTCALGIPALDGSPDFQITAIPISDKESRFMLMDGIGRGAFLVVVSQPHRERLADAERLSLLFDLTPAESRLAAALAQGLSLKEYAQDADLSEHTVRWTTKRLMAKADCQRQSDLVRYFSTAAATWG